LKSIRAAKGSLRRRESGALYFGAFRPAVDLDDTLPDRWLRHAAVTPEREAIVHWRAGEPPFRWTWGRLLDAAAGYAGQLEQRGVRRGDVCAVLIRHHELFYPLYLGLMCLGALPSVLAYPNSRLHPEKFREGLTGMAARSGLDWLLTERALHPTLEPLLASTGTTIRGVLFPLEGSETGAPGPFRPVSASAADACLLQHSSGTTGLQKGVVLSHRAVLEHVRRYGAAIAASGSDRIVSWLPLYHDMGLIAAFHLPLALGIPVVQLDPFEWVAAPVLWAEVVSREAGTLSWLPNFAYNLMAERVRDDELLELRLDSVRMLVNCSEPVQAQSHARFHDRFAGAGLRAEALAACYAMAETTFAVTQTLPGQAARSLDVERGTSDLRLRAPGRRRRRPASPRGPRRRAGRAIRVVVRRLPAPGRGHGRSPA
jgi:acyl-CoA synthetase (AMP-forming)/AMP-acid ligase II